MRSPSGQWPDLAPITPEIPAIGLGIVARLAVRI